ncbi:MAG: YdiU family protein [Microbacterium sp.]|uniref:protein adenylyltransferase SelO family protein n=1 Tax=Microbacterium sp. TaxID=51671 RepID=UPI001AD2C9A6|nr:protein adenylyltransferase SelO family protein [Microbacterium sp.]MBN9178427.1 YdiU family protein [Microbacterium sp.]
MSDAAVSEARPAGTVGLAAAWAQALPELSVPVRLVSPRAPRLLAADEPLLRDLGFDVARVASSDGGEFFAGAYAARAVAQVYAGHQWGSYRPILGDGRAALLGEARDARGRLRDIHLKGIGPTPMSRVDGFATVGPMLREFLVSAAMHALGVPTTRALAVIATGAPRVPRVGEDDILPGAVLARTAASHARFGSFEYAHHHPDPGLLRRLADHVIDRHYSSARSAAEPYRALLEAVVDAVASVTALWMRRGFVHGVLSTDNVLVSAETIDYGPCAFVDEYDPQVVFSTLDQHGRYAHDRQPAIMAWNLARLGEALAPLLASSPSAGEATAAEIVATFDARYRAHRRIGFRAQLGLDDRVPAREIDEVAEAAFELIERHRVDYTGFWRDLAAAAEGEERAVRARFLGEVPDLDAWLVRWRSHAPSGAALRRANPIYIPRNHLVDEALDAAVGGDLVPFDRLLALVRDPFTRRAGAEYRRYAWPAPAGHPPHRTFCGT